MQKSMQTLIDAVSRRLGYLPPVAREVTLAVTRELAEVIARGDAVRVPGLGWFGRRHCSAKRGRHPTTGERLEIPAHFVPTFRPSLDLRRRVWPGLRSGRRRAGK